MAAKKTSNPSKLRKVGFVGVRMTEPMIADARVVAKSQNRSLSNYLLDLVDRDVASHRLANPASFPSSGNG